MTNIDDRQLKLHSSDDNGPEIWVRLVLRKVPSLLILSRVGQKVRGPFRKRRHSLVTPLKGRGWRGFKMGGFGE